MSIPITLRSDFDADALRRVAKVTKAAAQARRLLALADIDEKDTQTDAARICGVGLQTVRDWGLAFDGEGPEGLIRRQGAGQSLQAERRAATSAGADHR